MRTRFEDIALWAFGDFALGQDFDLISDMTRARRFGFHDVVDSEAMLLRILRHALTSLEREPGCQRFDVHQERSDPTLFFLIEAYSDQAALDAHRASAHYQAFREDTKRWVVERTWWFWTPLGPAPGA
jgi:quinol monooxygenase YgiN